MALYHPDKHDVTGPNGIQSKVIYGKDGEFFCTRWGMPCKVERRNETWVEVDSYNDQMARDERRKAAAAEKREARSSGHEPIGGRPCERIPLAPDPRIGKSMMWK